MDRCCGYTRRGERCKVHTCSMVKSYGVSFHQCRFHKYQNVIFKWSHDFPHPEMPPDILLYLNMFWSLTKQIDFVKSVPLVMMTTFTFLNNKNQDPSDSYTVRDIFYETLLDPCSSTDECSICMSENIEVTTPCKHSYCRGCIYTWYDKKGTCPMCREQLFKRNNF